MHFTTKETKLIERLRKQERQWRWLRFVLPTLSLFVIGCYTYITVSLYHRLNWNALTIEDVFLVAMYWPKMLLAMCLTAWLIIWPAANWRGNATRILLLKLIEAQQSEKSDDEKIG